MEFDDVLAGVGMGGREEQDDRFIEQIAIAGRKFPDRGVAWFWGGLLGKMGEHAERSRTRNAHYRNACPACSAGQGDDGVGSASGAAHRMTGMTTGVRWRRPLRA